MNRKKIILSILLGIIAISAMIISDKLYKEKNQSLIVESNEEFEIPEYTGLPYVQINGNKPYWDTSEITTEVYETYSELDELGRCGVAYANICIDLMPTAEREEIGMIKPTGWHTIKYPEVIEDRYLYNRCHLIAYMLSGENANTRNLITGTRYMNTEGMLPFEIKVCDYVKKTGNHVLYKAVPIFKGDNLLADGVWLQAASVENDEIRFNVFCYNVQPGIKIDYSDGHVAD